MEVPLPAVGGAGPALYIALADAPAAAASPVLPQGTSDQHPETYQKLEHGKCLQLVRVNPFTGVMHERVPHHAASAAYTKLILQNGLELFTQWACPQGTPPVRVLMARHSSDKAAGEMLGRIPDLARRDNPVPPGPDVIKCRAFSGVSMAAVGRPLYITREWWSRMMPRGGSDDVSFDGFRAAVERDNCHLCTGGTTSLRGSNPHCFVLASNGNSH
jgi:hypothetical protein